MKISMLEEPYNNCCTIKADIAHEVKSLWKAAELSVKFTRADRSMTFLYPEAGTDYMYQSMWELHAHGVSVNKMDLLALKLRVLLTMQQLFLRTILRKSVILQLLCVCSSNKIFEAILCVYISFNNPVVRNALEYFPTEFVYLNDVALCALCLQYNKV